MLELQHGDVCKPVRHDGVLELQRRRVCQVLWRGCVHDSEPDGESDGEPDGEPDGANC